MHKKDVLIFQFKGADEINLPEEFNPRIVVDWIDVRKAIKEGIKEGCRFLIHSLEKYEGFFVQLLIEYPVNKFKQPVDFTWFVPKEEMKDFLMNVVLNAELEGQGLKKKEDGYYYSE